jgi:Na+-driven multidrug efflux pump
MTTDPAVQGLVGSVVPLFVVTLLFQGHFYSAEGVLLAQKDLSFVVGMYPVYFAIVQALILQLQRFGTSLQLRQVWASFMAHQWVRISIWVARVYLLFRRQIRASSANPGMSHDKSNVPDDDY